MCWQSKKEQKSEQYKETVANDWKFQHNSFEFCLNSKWTMLYSQDNNK